MPEQWPEYVVTYKMDGADWGITVIAKDAADASRRLRAIGMTGSVDGELVVTIPAGPCAGILARTVCAVRNLFIAKECERV
jgi:hypothetical protein